MNFYSGGWLQTCLKGIPKYAEMVQNRRFERISDGVGRTLLPAEMADVSRVEERRTHLAASNDRIQVMDYGAGNPTEQRTKEQMQAGVLSERAVSDIINSAKSQFWGEWLFKLVRTVRPRVCVELGTSLGISAAYQALALQHNGKGKLITLEGAPEIAAIARETLHQLGITNTSVVVGAFRSTLEETLRVHAPVDMFFNDGHHDYDAVVTNFKKALPYLASESLVVMDDIRWSAGMKKAWDELIEHPDVAVSLDMESVGLLLISKAGKSKAHHKLPQP